MYFNFLPNFFVVSKLKKRTSKRRTHMQCKTDPLVACQQCMYKCVSRMILLRQSQEGLLFLWQVHHVSTRRHLLANLLCCLYSSQLDQTWNKKHFQLGSRFGRYNK